MCGCHPAMECSGCAGAISRRDLLRGCGAAAALGALAPAAVLAEAPKAEKARIGLVFLSNSRGREMWPYPNYDCAARHKQILKLLGRGCPQVEFVPVVVKSPGEAKKAIALKDKVDGYLVYCTTLMWSLRGPLVQVARLGKPTVVADEILGGSGVFLIGYSAVRRQRLPVVGVSSAREADLVAVARVFAELKKPGMTPAAFVKRCEEVYHGTFPAAGKMTCKDDKVALTDIGECVKRFKQSRFLTVNRAGAQRDFLGAKGIYVGFPELKGFYDKVDRDAGAQWAARWSKRAEKVFETKPESVVKAGAVYLAMLEMLKKHGTDNITMNCLGGFAGGKLPAYPCLGFMQILDDGGQGVCEAMPDDTLSMLMARILTGRPGFVSDPAIDTSKNQVIYAHCMAMTKAFGPKGAANRFRIRTLHNQDPRGCCPQSFLPEGYMTTSFRTNVRRKEMVIHQAKAVGNLDASRGCRTQLVGEVRGDIRKLMREWDRFGWHRVTVYGDVQAPLMEFGKALGLKVVEET